MSHADQAVSAVLGQRDAQTLCQRLRDGHAPPDLLQQVLDEVAGFKDESRLAAFTRALQKRLERSAAADGDTE